ncbi:MAG: hypothetical protein AB1801_13720, partial [Chloroflexota bacterium]
LQISKSDGGGPVQAGGQITYTLTYTNSGTQDSAGVVITETLPTSTTFNSAASTAGWHQVGSTTEYTYSVGVLPVGPAQTVIFAVTVDASLPDGVNTITNNAAIADSQGFSGTTTLNTAITAPQEDPQQTIFLPIVLKDN